MGTLLVIVVTCGPLFLFWWYMDKEITKDWMRKLEETEASERRRQVQDQLTIWRRQQAIKEMEDWETRFFDFMDKDGVRYAFWKTMDLQSAVILKSPAKPRILPAVSRGTMKTLQ